MYSGPLHRTPFQPDPERMQHAAQREEYARKLREQEGLLSAPPSTMPHPPPQRIEKLLELVSPEDSALIALIIFLLCDNTNNDVVLLGILLYVLLAKEKRS
ncbi:MAG: hypothetical protein IKJ74_05060 [Clostridia bacterium]|nr:hypothetical protein [Clostridia bacterium]